MTAYVESSVIMRIVLGQSDRLAEWANIERVVTSTLTEVECLRTLDRRAHRRLLPAESYAERRGLLMRLIHPMNRIHLGPAVLRRASDAFPTPLRTLDAIHLSTALQWATAFEEPPILATHDAELGIAARAMGFIVLGI